MNYAILAAMLVDSGSEMEIGDAAVVAIFGYSVVFFGLVLLMCVLYITGGIFKSRDEKAKAAKAEEAKKSGEEAPAASAPAAEAPSAPGSAGHVKLHGVPDKEAVMIMAIVADNLKTPLNELRFISIKEVK